MIEMDVRIVRLASFSWDKHRAASLQGHSFPRKRCRAYKLLLCAFDAY